VKELDILERASRPSQGCERAARVKARVRTYPYSSKAHTPTQSAPVLRPTQRWIQPNSRNYHCRRSQTIITTDTYQAQSSLARRISTTLELRSLVSSTCSHVGTSWLSTRMISAADVIVNTRWPHQLPLSRQQARTTPKRTSSSLRDTHN
jgi:hypothetical protein